MTEPEKTRTVVREAAQRGKDTRSTRWIVVLSVITVLLLGYGGWLTARYQAQASANTGVANELERQVRALGQRPVATPVPGPASPSAVAGPAGPVGPGPTQQQIDEAVSRQLAAHPPAAGRSATPAMVATAVAGYLTANPPAPGRPPTQTEIASAASFYIAAHPATFKGATGVAGASGMAGTAGKDGAAGAAGKDGAPGPAGPPGADATDAQVAAAVATYCSDHNSCAGPTGPAGVSETDGQFQRDSSGACMYVLTFSDGSTRSHPAGDAACPITVGAGAPGKAKRQGG